MNPITVRDKASLVLLNCAFSWGTVTDKRLTDATTTEQGAVAGSLRVRKTLLPKAAGKLVEDVRSVLSEFYVYHTAKTYGTQVRGQRVMPSAFYMDYMERFGQAKAKSRDALAALVDGYPAAVEQARELLVGSFNEADYPEAEEIERYLSLEVKFLPIPTGDAIMGALGAAVAADVDLFVGDMMKTAAEDARARLHEAVQRMAERLTTKGSKIYDSMPATINDLARELPVIAGLAGDADLAALVKEVQATLAGYSGEDFRNNEAVKTDVGAAAMVLLKKMGGAA